FHPRDDDFAEVAVKFDPKTNVLELNASTHLGPAGSWSHDLAGVTASVRIVLSARDKPQSGTRHRPACEVDVRVRLLNAAATDGIERLDQNRWLSITTIPLTRTNKTETEVPITAPVAIAIDGTFSDTEATTIRPVRLSTFTPATWCQFAESMSVFSGSFAA